MYSIALLICLLICSAIASDEHGSLRGLKKKEWGFLVEEQEAELEEPLQVEMELEFEGDKLDGEAVSFEDVNDIADLFKDGVNENGSQLKDESIERVELNEVSAALAQNDDPSERKLRKKNRFKFHSRFTGVGRARRSRKNRALTIERELHGAPKKAADDMKRLLQNKLDEFVKANHTIKKGKVKDLEFKFDSEC